MQGAKHKMLPDGRRLHLYHGPVDLIIEASGDEAEVARAYQQAIERFRTVLTELVEELPLLRNPVSPKPCPLYGSTARRMWAATAAHVPIFVTPMAAVAGSVADEVLAAMLEGRRLRLAYVNNGGDIAIHLEQGESFRLGLVVDPGNPRSPGFVEITQDMPIRGIATSGRHGRSLSLGIADSVTALAVTAAAADAAATLIANAVDLPGHPEVGRVPARSLKFDSDLGERLITVAVGQLSETEVSAALAAGAGAAQDMIEYGLLQAAVLVLADKVRIVGHLERHQDALRWASQTQGREDRAYA